MALKLAFIGFGNVARAFARMLEQKQSELASNYGLRWDTTAIATAHHGCVTSIAGIDLIQAAACVERGGDLAELPHSLSLSDPIELIETCDAGLLFETSPLNVENGEPAVDYIRRAL